MLTFQNELLDISKNLYCLGYVQQATKLLLLGEDPKAKRIVEILIKIFHPVLGDFLAGERARNLATGIRYFEPGDDDPTDYIIDRLMVVNTPMYVKGLPKAYLSSGLPLHTATKLAKTAVKMLQHEGFLPREF